MVGIDGARLRSATRASILTMESSNDLAITAPPAPRVAAASEEIAEDAVPTLIMLPAEDAMGVCEPDGECR